MDGLFSTKRKRKEKCIILEKKNCPLIGINSVLGKAPHIVLSYLAADSRKHKPQSCSGERSWGRCHKQRKGTGREVLRPLGTLHLGEGRGQKRPDPRAALWPPTALAHFLRALGVGGGGAGTPL